MSKNQVIGIAIVSLSILIVSGINCIVGSLRLCNLEKAEVRIQYKILSNKITTRVHIREKYFEMSGSNLFETENALNKQFEKKTTDMMKDLRVIERSDAYETNIESERKAEKFLVTSAVFAIGSTIVLMIVIFIGSTKYGLKIP
jgi:hypothetical protein